MRKGTLLYSVLRCVRKRCCLVCMRRKTSVEPGNVKKEIESTGEEDARKALEA